MAKQVYLNVGNFLLGVAALGLDAVPIEGFDAAIFDEEFGLKEKGYTSLVVVPVGHHSVEDFNATLPKSRLPQNITLTEVEFSLAGHLPGYFPSDSPDLHNPVSAVIIGCCCIKETLCRI